MPWPPQDPTGFYRFVPTNQLRCSLSEEINRAAFGNEPIIVTRRGRKVAALVSIADLMQLEGLKRRLSRTSN